MRDADENKSHFPSGIVIMRHGHREDSDNPLWQTKARFPFDTPLAAVENEICAAARELKAAGRTFDGKLFYLHVSYPETCEHIQCAPAHFWFECNFGSMP
ncbi:hypothetical protein Vretimale_597 [Volvox reticuliferus]|uniref:Uncharacterized protein n=1 Tax=Volvox reticuliferus TaxID=1737510 RepID=A0A8J4C5E4_9CHLO|nr:hypothetical protein Vretifemale_2394 [Volvox reticuliferus]GIL94378.1 hypothetical protein Vretimale_597 [Volvox reticuliferus]